MELDGLKEAVVPGGMLMARHLQDGFLISVMRPIMTSKLMNGRFVRVHLWSRRAGVGLEAVLGGLEVVMVPGEVLEARHLALQQSIVKYKPSLLETLSFTIEKLWVIESEANPNHSCLFGCQTYGVLVSEWGSPSWLVLSLSSTR